MRHRLLYQANEKKEKVITVERPESDNQSTSYIVKKSIYKD